MEDEELCCSRPIYGPQSDFIWEGDFQGRIVQITVGARFSNRWGGGATLDQKLVGNKLIYRKYHYILLIIWLKSFAGPTVREKNIPLIINF